ncbi:YitT family protein [Sutcliffiella cohnii]|uniref:YitT family protein n=1 Tax=Sutcliffiella cohnii TaxID=33932 RepID=UPI002E1B9EFE|nr:YitT family protein [Sutcliffiella cohnii]
MKQLLLKGLFLGVGATIQGLAMALFLFPHFIPSGGAASVGVLLYYLLQVPYGITLWVLNASLLFIAFKWLGKNNALWTLFCVSVTSFTISYITPFIHGTISYVFVDLVFGAILFGIGIGMLFRLGASSGGMDILALIISKHKRIIPGKTLFCINTSLLLLTSFVVDWRILIYAVSSQFISTKILDIVNTINFANKTEKATEQKRIA